MEKKFYSRPTCKVVVLDMSDIVCQSATGIGGGTVGNGGSSTNYTGDNARAKNRGDIWGED